MCKDPNVVKRPITAGVSRSIFSNQRSQERLASTKALQENSYAKHAIRRQIFLRGFSGKSEAQPKVVSHGILTTKS